MTSVSEDWADVDWSGGSALNYETESTSLSKRIVNVNQLESCMVLDPQLEFQVLELECECIASNRSHRYAMVTMVILRGQTSEMSCHVPFELHCSSATDKGHGAFKHWQFHCHINGTHLVLM